MLLTSLRYFGLTLILASLVFLSMALSPAIEILADLELEMIGDRWNQILDVVASRTVGLLLTGTLISAIYLLAPYKRLPWRSLLPGITVATVLIEIGKQLSATYMTSAAGYSAIYGSVSSIIVLLLWLYFAARVVLYGAELIKISSDNAIKES